MYYVKPSCKAVFGTVIQQEDAKMHLHLVPVTQARFNNATHLLNLDNSALKQLDFVNYQLHHNKFRNNAWIRLYPLT